MEPRAHERWYEIPEHYIYSCSICHESIVGPTRCVQSRRNPLWRRHVECVPKSRYVSPEEQAAKDAENTAKRAAPSKRRKAGGHGYTGGDGWTMIT